MPECVLICGFGAFGEMHAKAWRLLDPDMILMVADPSERARMRASQLGVSAERIAADPAVLLESADIVDVVAPPAFHLPLALLALAAGKPVLIEKPAVKSVSEAKTLLAASGALPVQVGLVLRAHPLVAQATQLLGADEIGDLLAIEGDFRGWKRMRADSSIIENDGVHFLDLMRYFADAAIAHVEARSWSLLDADVADDIAVELGFPNGVKGRLRLGVLAAGDLEDAFVPGALTTKRLTLMGRKGNISIDFNTNRLTLSKVAYMRSAGGHDVKPDHVSVHAALGATPEVLLARSFAALIEATRGNAPVLCDVEQGAREIAAVLAAIDTSLERQSFTPVAVEGGSS